MRNSLIIIIIILCTCLNLNAFDNVFLQTAKTAGTGSAVTANADDLSTFILNPAGVSKNNNLQLLGEYFDLYGAGFESSLLGAYYPAFDSGGAGFVWQRINYQSALQFNDIENVYYLILSKEILSINFGLNIKYFNEVINASALNLNNNEYNIDFGMIKSFQRFGIGFSLLNIKSLLNKNDNLDYLINLGIYYKILQNLKILCDYRDIEQQNRINIGLEFILLEDLTLRAGWYMDNFYGFGISYTITHFRVDYTFTLNQYEVGTTHYFSINYFFNP